MASRTPEGASPRPALPAPLIRPPSLSDRTADPGHWRVLISSCLVSGVVHLALIGAGLLFVIPSGSATESHSEVTILETRIEDETKPPDFDDTDIGFMPDVPAGYAGEQPRQFNVPGPQNADDLVGLVGGPEGPPADVPPPAGLGEKGSGGGIVALLPGHAPLIGLPNGFAASSMKPGGPGGRVGETRRRLLRTEGGNRESEAAVARGLEWLAKHQAPDGHWSLDGFRRDAHCNCAGPGQNQDIAATAFGLLPFLGAGQTHKATAEGSTKYRKNVERGLKYLLLKQNSDGDFGSGQWEMYAHGLASIAVCEAYGLTSDPMLKGPAQRALNFIARSQSAAGGWSYNAPCTGYDTSVGGWQLMALKSGQMAGLEVSPKTMAAAKSWLDDVADADGSGYGYQAKGSSPTMSSVGLLCREYMGWGPRNPGLRKGVAHLLEQPPGSFPSMYYYYYATQVVHHFGGQPWQQWNPRMRDLLIRTQDKGSDRRHAHQKGSWGPAGDAHGGVGGRVMITSMSLLSLEVYYRYLPLYRRDMGANKK